MCNHTLPQNTEDAAAVGKKDLNPVSPPHLGKVDAPKKQSREKENAPFSKRAMVNFFKGCRDGHGTVGPAPCFVNFRLCLLDADAFRGKCHSEWTKIEPVLWSR